MSLPSERSTTIPEPQRRPEQLLLQEAKEDRCELSLVSPGMFRIRTLVLHLAEGRYSLAGRQLQLWSQAAREEKERVSERAVSYMALTGPGDRSSMCPVVGHFLFSVELGSQLGGMKRCLDAVADGLQPSYFSPLHQLLKNTLLSKPGTVFAFLKVVPAFLHSVLGSEFRSCLAKIPALLVLWARALAPVLVVCCLGRKEILQGSLGPGRASKSVRDDVPGSVDPDDVQVAEVDALLVHQRGAGAALGAARPPGCTGRGLLPWVFRSCAELRARGRCLGSSMESHQQQRDHHGEVIHSEKGLKKKKSPAN